MSAVVGRSRGSTPLLRVVENAPSDPGAEPGPLRRALATLGRHRSPSQVLGTLPTAAVALGFDRAALLPARDGAEFPALVAGTGPATRNLQVPDLSGLTALLRSTAEPDLVSDRRRCAVVAALLDDRDVIPGFVLAPVLADSGVVAVLYADLARAGVPTGPEHVDLLATFAVAAGHVLAGARLRVMLDRVTSTVDAPPEPRTHGVPGSAVLTAREVDVLRLMSVGRTNAQVGRELRISEGTVKSHVKSVFRKLDAVNRAEAVARWLALRGPGVPPPPPRTVPMSAPDGSGTRWN